MSVKSAVEGWLVKKKAKDRNAFFSKDNLRYFKIQEVKGQDYAELAFCYFKTQKDKEARGWIYLKDITEIYDDEKAFTLVSAARTMTIEAQNPTEYMMWLQTLVEYCPNADVRNLRTPVSSSKKNSTKSTQQSKDSGDYQTLEALDVRPPPGNTKSFSKSVSLFSRQADGENNSFYLPAQGIHKVYSSSQSDIDAMEQPMPYQNRELEDTDDENHVSGPRNNKKDITNNNNNYPYRNSSPRANDKEDHRKQAYRGGGSTSANTTNRLHQHISKESNNKSNSKNLQRFPSEIEEISLEQPTQNKTRKGGRPVIGPKVDSNGSMFSLAEVDENDDNYDGAESETRYTSSPNMSNHNNSSNNLMYSSNSLHAVSGSSEDLHQEPPQMVRQLTKMNGVNMTINANAAPAESKETPKAAQPSPTAGGGKRAMPSNAPPKRAVESLTQVEAAINDTNTNSGKRLSIDELLYRKKASPKAADAKSSFDDRQSGSKNLDDSDEEELDFKAELRHYSNNVNTASSIEGSLSTSSATSKPPRAPTNTKSPYSNPLTNTSTNNVNQAQGHSSHQRSSTPPRRPQDPGAKTDSNFVTDNWDEEEDDDLTRRGKRGGAGGNKSNTKHQQHAPAEEKYSSTGRENYGNTVKQDENWLEDNFDDD